MDAIVLDSYGLSFKTNAPDPRVRPADALLRVRAVGICGTDMAIVNETLKVPLPIIPGHEIVATIEQVGTDVPERVADM